jgi:hypothetical protein
MKKITNLFSSIGLLLLGLFMFTSKAYADLAPFPGGGGGGRVSPNPDNSTIILIGAGVGVGVVAIVSWLVIRAIRRKKNVINK